ncbi:MAG: ANTAR domain-containing protein [Clostridia bacterium]
MKSFTKRIVIVAKEPLAKKLRIRLQEAGFFEIELCSTGGEALRFLDTYTPDLLLMTYLLSDMLAVDLLHAVPPRCPVLLLVTRDLSFTKNLSENVLLVPTPIGGLKLVRIIELALQMHKQQQMSKPSEPRSQEEQELLIRAKKLLMQQQGISERAAHSRLQHMSMQGHKKVTEVAKLILELE